MTTRTIQATLGLLLLGAAAHSQTSRGTIAGTVLDASGAVVVRAQVILLGEETGSRRSTTTNESGLYRFDAVDLGSYSVNISASGFGPVTKTNVLVNANQTSAVDAQLSPGEQQITVDVVSEAGAALQTEAPVRGGNCQATDR